jgi:hypothetical protein
MIIRVTTKSRPQQRYDHRLRDLVQRTGDLTIATDLGVPRSTARGWLGAAPRIVVKTAIILFNWNANFTQVLTTLEVTVPKHACFKRATDKLDESAFRYIPKAFRQQSQTDAHGLTFDVPVSHREPGGESTRREVQIA